VHDLIVIAHHAQVAARPGEQVDERCLRVAYILELVDENPSPSLSQPSEPVRLL
jgi:hypothetical protein